MKKFILIVMVMFLAVATHAQTIASLTSAKDTIHGNGAGNTRTWTSPAVTQGYRAWTVEVYVTTTGTHATDSTHAEVYASMDGTNYFKLTDLGTPYLIGTSAYYSSTVVGTKLSSAGTGAVGWVWHMNSPLPYRYIQVKLTQYKLLSIITMTRGKLHLYK